MERSKIRPHRFAEIGGLRSRGLELRRGRPPHRLL